MLIFFLLTFLFFVTSSLSRLPLFWSSLHFFFFSSLFYSDCFSFLCRSNGSWRMFNFSSDLFCFWICFDNCVLFALILFVFFIVMRPLFYVQYRASLDVSHPFSSCPRKYSLHSVWGWFFLLLHRLHFRCTEWPQLELGNKTNDPCEYFEMLSANFQRNGSFSAKWKKLMQNGFKLKLE